MPAQSCDEPAGFPIRTSPDITPAHGSPRLFAVFHVLLRRLTPRHPPYALSSFLPLMRRSSASTSLRDDVSTTTSSPASPSSSLLLLFFAMRLVKNSGRVGRLRPHLSARLGRRRVLQTSVWATGRPPNTSFFKEQRASRWRARSQQKSA